MINTVKIFEGKSKIICKEPDSDEYLYLQFKGDVRCSKHPAAYSRQIAYLRAKTNVSIFKYLSQKMSGICQAELIGPDTIKMPRINPIPLEWIPRYVAAGSVVKRFRIPYGHHFEKPVLKIDYKTDEDDYLINDDLIIACGLLNSEELSAAKHLCMQIADELNALFDSKGLELWDFKLELGKSANGDIMLMDEISFDGMRLKDKITKESYDKDVYRDTGDVSLVIKAYEKGYERVFGNGI